MYKKVLFGMVAFALLSVLLAACTIRDASVVSGPEVHMGGSNFIQSTITVKKGEMLNFVDDAASPHVIVNGSWVNGTAKPSTEAGAPAIKLNFTGQGAQQAGPFNTAGTFHVYCTIHPGMNLAITVQ